MGAYAVVLRRIKHILKRKIAPIDIHNVRENKMEKMTQ
jgi:hypothetical protein